MTEIVLTLKAGTGFDSPWVVIHADTADEASVALAEVGKSGLPEQIVGASRDLQARYTAGVVLGTEYVNSEPTASPAEQQASSARQQLAAPPQEQEQARPPTPSCKHGVRVYRPDKKNNPPAWQAFFCPSPKGTPDQCPAIFF